MAMVCKIVVLLIVVQVLIQDIQSKHISPDDNRSDISNKATQTDDKPEANQPNIVFSRLIDSDKSMNEVISNPDALKSHADRVSISEVNSQHNEEMSLSTEQYKYVHKVSSATQYNAAQEETTVMNIENQVTASNGPHNESILPASNNSTDKKTVSIPGTPDFVLPDRVEKYSNNILLEGHVFGIREDIIYMIHSSLSSGSYFTPVQPLRVTSLSSTYEEMSYDGDRVTRIYYAVSYNGRPVHREIVSMVMKIPKVSTHMDSQLAGKHLRQYMKSVPVDEQSWIQGHLTAVVVPSCIVFVLIVALSCAAVLKKRSRKAAKLAKKMPVASGMQCEKKFPPPAYDTPSNIENPAYDYETNDMTDPIKLRI